MSIKEEEVQAKARDNLFNKIADNFPNFEKEFYPGTGGF
jgi:hypothetical protein